MLALYGFTLGNGPIALVVSGVSVVAAAVIGRIVGIPQRPPRGVSRIRAGARDLDENRAAHSLIPAREKDSSTMHRIALLHRLDDHQRPSDRPSRKRETAESATEVPARPLAGLTIVLTGVSILGLTMADGHGLVVAGVFGVFAAAFGLTVGFLKRLPAERSDDTRNRPGSVNVGRSTESPLHLGPDLAARRQTRRAPTSPRSSRGHSKTDSMSGPPVRASFLIIMPSFRGPRTDQQYWVWPSGIAFALIARTGFILPGAALINSFAWICYRFGQVLIVIAGHMLKPEREDTHSGENVMVRVAAGYSRRVSTATGTNCSQYRTGRG